MTSSDSEQVSGWPPPRPETIILLGNRLCLDFANTLVWRLREWPLDLLESYEALIAWHRHAESIDNDLADRLLQAARGQEAEAASTVRRATAMREAVYRIFLATIEGGQPAAADLECGAGASDGDGAGAGVWGGLGESDRAGRRDLVAVGAGDAAGRDRCLVQGRGWRIIAGLSVASCQLPEESGSS